MSHPTHTHRMQFVQSCTQREGCYDTEAYGSILAPREEKSCNCLGVFFVCLFVVVCWLVGWLVVGFVVVVVCLFCFLVFCLFVWGFFFFFLIKHAVRPQDIIIHVLLFTPYCRGLIRHPPRERKTRGSIPAWPEILLGRVIPGG